VLLFSTQKNTRTKPKVVSPYLTDLQTHSQAAVGVQTPTNLVRNFYIKTKLDKINAPDLPTLIYLHSHSGCRTEGAHLVDLFAPDFGVCLFDFSGCGKSEGQYVTLGIKEQDDLIAVIQWLKERQITNIALWGRSMGAATALNFTYNSNNAIKCLILDSPFTKVAEMVRDTMSSLRGTNPKKKS
jgi:pimeloyl-ACP methyl ester carboxylesterase